MSHEHLATDNMRGDRVLVEPDFREGLYPAPLSPELQELAAPIDSYPEIYGPVEMAETDKGHCDVLGVSVEEGGCNAAIIAGEGVAFVDICIYNPDEPNKAERRVRLTQTSDERHAIYGFVPDMKPGDLYGVRAYGTWDPSRQLIVNPHKLLLDPYAKAITGQFVGVDAEQFTVPDVGEEVSWDGHYIGPMNPHDSAPYMPRSVVVDTKAYDWEGDVRPNTPIERAILYETHVRDMTMRHPEVPEEIRGTYAGMAHPAIIKHLKELGITSLELMPVQQFETDTPLQQRGKKNHWGYQTSGFFAPHNAYASSGERGQQVDEFRDMVKALHAAGIEIVLDVVYNHTPEGNEFGPTIGPKGLINKEFYHRNGQGRHNNDSGCGNTINASSEIGRQLIMDSLRYWVEDMHVDGFRFDLATILARVSPSGRIDMGGSFMQALMSDEVLKDVKLFAEPWDVTDYELGHFPPGFDGEWNGQIRDGTRDYFLGNGGWQSYASRQESGILPNGVRSVAFVAVHDGFPLRDLTEYNYKHNEANGEGNGDGESHNRSYNFGCEGPTDVQRVNERRERAIRAMILSVLTIPGSVPLILHGDEMGRTQQGNNNTYCQDNEISWLDWDLSEEQQAQLAFTKRATALRSMHSAFQQRGGLQFRYPHDTWQGDPKIFGIYLHEEPHRGDSLVVVPNGTHDDLPFWLPTGGWEMVANSATGQVMLERTHKPIVTAGELAVPGLATVVMRRVS